MYYVGPYLICVQCGFIPVLFGSIPSLCLCGSIPSTIHLKIILNLVSCYNIIFNGIMWLCGSIMGNSMSVIGKIPGIAGIA